MNNTRLHESQISQQFDLPKRKDESIKEVSQYFMWAITHPERFVKLLTGRKKENR